MKNVKAELYYPGREGPDWVSKQGVEIELVDSRASDGLLVRYDYVRDGWVIYQPMFGRWAEGVEPDPGYTEVAFLPSWGETAFCSECEDMLIVEKTGELTCPSCEREKK